MANLWRVEWSLKGRIDRLQRRDFRLVIASILDEQEDSAPSSVSLLLCLPGNWAPHPFRAGREHENKSLGIHQESISLVLDTARIALRERARESQGYGGRGSFGWVDEQTLR